MRIFGITMFKWSNPVVKWVILAFVFLFVLAAGLDIAEGAEFRLGVGGASANSYDPRDIDTIVVESSALLWDEHLDLSVGIIGEQFETVDPYLYGSATVVFYFGMKERTCRPNIGLGAAVRGPGGENLMPLPVNFSLQAGADCKGFLGLKRVGIMYRHFSNAGIKQPNRGQNLFLITGKF